MGKLQKDLKQFIANEKKEVFKKAKEKYDNLNLVQLKEERLSLKKQWEKLKDAKSDLVYKLSLAGFLSRFRMFEMGVRLSSGENINPVSEVAKEAVSMINPIKKFKAIKYTKSKNLKKLTSKSKNPKVLKLIARFKKSIAALASLIALIARKWEYVQCLIEFLEEAAGKVKEAADKLKEGIGKLNPAY